MYIKSIVLPILILVFLGLPLTFPVCSYAQNGVPISKEYFCEMLISRLKYYDKNKDNYLSDTELREVKYLYYDAWSEDRVKPFADSVRGLEYLPYLKTVYISCADIQFSDFNKLRNLKKIELHDCNFLTDKLDLSELVNLKKLVLTNTNITKLEFGENSTDKLTYFSYISDKTYLDVDVSKMVNLKVLKCSTDKLDISHNAELMTLRVCGDFSEINLKSNMKLENLNLKSDKLTNVDISNHSKLKVFNINSSSVKSIITGNNSSLKRMIVKCAALSEINLSEMQNLKKVKITGDNLTDLNIGKKPKLNKLIVISNKIKNIDISGASILKNMVLIAPLNTVDTSKNTRLEYMEIDCNIWKIDLSNNRKLKNIKIQTPLPRIYVNWTRISGVEISLENTNIVTQTEYYKNISRLSLHNSNAKKVDVSKMINMELLSIVNSDVEEIYISGKNKLLKDLSIWNDKPSKLRKVYINNKSYSTKAEYSYFLRDGSEKCIEERITNDVLKNRFTHEYTVKYFFSPVEIKIRT